MKLRTLSIALILLLATWASAATVNIPAGVYPTYNFQSGNTYIGAGKGKTIIRNQSTAGFAHTITVNGSNGISISNLTCDGNGIKADNSINFSVTDVEVVNCKRNQDDHQGFNAYGTTGLTLTRVTFRNCNWGLILNGPCKNTNAVDCVFESCGINFKAMLDGGAHDLLVLRQLTKWSSYYGIEIQPNGHNNSTPNVQSIDCAQIEPSMHYGGSTQNTGGISMPGEKNTGWAIRGFYFDGNCKDGSKPDGGWIGPALIMELSGTNCEVENCDIRNGNDPLSVNLAAVSPLIKSLRYTNVRELPDYTGKSYSNSNHKSPFPNNGPNQAVNCGGAAIIGGVVTTPPVTQPTPPTTQYIDDPIIEIRAIQKSGKVTVTKP